MIGFGLVDLGAEVPRKKPTVLPRISYSLIPGSVLRPFVHVPQ